MTAGNLVIFNILELAELIDPIEVAALETTGESLSLVLHGGAFSFGLNLEWPIWNAEDDERETDDEGNYKETVQEFILRSLEEKAHAILKTVKAAREDLKEESRESCQLER